MFLKMFVVAILATFITSCASQYAVINGGGGGSRTVRHDSPKVKSAATVFGNQPMNPTPDAVSSTWGATMSSEYWYNDARKGDRALLQRTSSNEPVLVSRSSGFVWRSGCYNRVTPAQAFTEEVVADAGGGGNQTIIQNGPSYKLEFNLPITIIGGGESYQPYQQYTYRQHYEPQRRVYCPPVRRYCPPPRPYCPPPRPYCPPRPCPPRCR